MLTLSNKNEGVSETSIHTAIEKIVNTQAAIHKY